jgi:hypothetical protein
VNTESTAEFPSWSHSENEAIIYSEIYTYGFIGNAEIVPHQLTYTHKGKVMLSLCLIKHYAMKMYGGMDV